MGTGSVPSSCATGQLIVLSVSRLRQNLSDAPHLCSRDLDISVQRFFDLRDGQAELDALQLCRKSGP